MRHQPVIARESARVGGVAGFEPVKNSIVVARPYHYTMGVLPGFNVGTVSSCNQRESSDRC